MSLNYTKSFFFISKLLKKFFFFIVIFVSILFKKLFTKSRDEKRNFKSLETKNKLLIKFRNQNNILPNNLLTNALRTQVNWTLKLINYLTKN